ncbi:hypothetical protein V8B97DRAFT_2022618 [Scleroderma yunnanense]
MGRQQGSLNKKPLIPESSGKRKMPSSENVTLEAIHCIKEVGKQAHLQAEKMWKAYDGHVDQGCKWLQSHTSSGSSIPTSIVEDIYNDPGFKDTFEKVPNHCSDKALALYLSWRGFHENWSWSTVEGNPTTSAEVDDVMASIKHKVTAEGSDCMHSSAMKKEYMDKILTLSMTACPELKSVLHFISLVLTRMASASSWHGISNDMKKCVTWYLGLLAFASTAWIIWTRCFELVKLKWEDIQITDVTMVNHVLTKYLRGKQNTLATNKRDVYHEIHLRNQKDLTSCNLFFWLMVWVRWLEHVHLGWVMVDEDFIFPVIGVNGIVKLCKQLSQDAVQKWISKETTEGAQYWFMYAPIGQWADGEHCDMLIHYLLDELHCYENNHSNALGPFPHKVDMSLAGEHALAAPATREDLRLLQSSVSMETYNLDNSLQAILGNVTNSLQDLTQVICLSQVLSTTASSLPPPSSTHGAPSFGSIIVVPLLLTPAISPSPATLESDMLAYLLPSPFIPDVPFTHLDGKITPWNEAWKDIIQHWEKDVPEKQLPLLRDWPYEFIHGPNCNLQSKYNQWCVIVLEFLDQ